MFGYVRYDLPNLFVKDVALYQALYCGLCRGIGACCGHAARAGLSYDVTFLSALLHNMTGTDIVIEQRGCFGHTVRKKPMAKTDALTEELGAFNTMLVYYKLADDVADSGKGRGKRLYFRRGFLRAKKKYPELAELVGNFLKTQSNTETSDMVCLDSAAEPTARFMETVSDHFLKGAATEHTRALFYGLGKWVYLIDALDDYEKDASHAFNPFVRAYGAKSREQLMSENGEEISFLFDTLFYSIREHLAFIEFHFNRDLTDNVILRGLPLETARVMKGEPRPRMSVKIS